MPRKASPRLKWLEDVEGHDFDAAVSYLGLIYAGKRSVRLVAALRAAKPSRFKAKDIFRASQLSLLGVSNSHVDKDRRKIKKGIPLSPLLLVRDGRNGKVLVADGYHRLCAVYQADEDAWIPCRIV
jgi:hypothetical protein